jgi:hypothetical protein
MGRETENRKFDLSKLRSGTSVTHRNLIFVITLCIAFVATGTHSAWAQYVFRSIDVPGAAQTVVNDNNNDDVFPVCYSITNFDYDFGGQAGSLLSHGVFKPLSYPGGTGTCPEGVSGNGKVVGSYEDKSGNVHGFLLVGTKYTSFDYPGAAETVGYGVNNSGTIVGFYYDGTAYHGFKLKGGVFTNIDPPGAASSEAEAINDKEQVAGGYSLTDKKFNSDLQAYVLSGGSYTTINYPGATGTVAGGINNSADTAGWYFDSSGVTHGFTDISGTLSTLDYPGAAGTEAAEINDSGQVTGDWESSTPGDEHGFLATPPNGLNAPGGESRDRRASPHR